MISKNISSTAALFSVALGVGIFFISLMGASQVSSHESESSTTKKLYFGQEILPDHLFYPILMMADKITLESSPPKEAVYREVHYSLDRLDSAARLLEKGDHERALSTLTKSQKYLLAAGHTVQENNLTASERLYVKSAIAHQSEETEKLLPKFSDAEIAIISNILEETRALAAQL